MTTSFGGTAFCAWGFAGGAFCAMTPGEPKHVIAATSAAAIQQSERWTG
jgi:hypothetical protein